MLPTLKNNGTWGSLDLDMINPVINVRRCFRKRERERMCNIRIKDKLVLKRLMVYVI